MGLRPPPITLLSVVPTLATRMPAPTPPIGVPPIPHLWFRSSYVPEIPWDDSCASSLIAAFNGYSSPTAPIAFVTRLWTPSHLPEAVARARALREPAPSWCRLCQALLASVRGRPERRSPRHPGCLAVRSDGKLGPLLLFCDSDGSHSGTACVGSPGRMVRAGGTSFASPIMAGIQALVNQRPPRAKGIPHPPITPWPQTSMGRRE